MTNGRKPQAVPRQADDKKQSRAFIERARELEADEEKSRADELLGRMAKMKPEPRKKGDAANQCGPTRPCVLTPCWAA